MPVNSLSVNPTDSVNLYSSNRLLSVYTLHVKNHNHT